MANPELVLAAIRAEQKRRDAIQLLRSDFRMFVRRVFRTVKPAEFYVENWHIEAICEALDLCRRGKIRRLIINMPPRSMKSITISVAWPAWILGHNPSAQIMCASYSQNLSFRDSQDCRLVMQSSWYRQIFPDTILSDDQNEKRKFVTTKRGHRMATSVGASTATGEGGDFLIVDDPLNPTQALSDGPRESANTWVGQTFMNRLNDKVTGVVVIVMQRLHEDDVTGHQLAKGGWDHLCLPAKVEKKTIIDVGRFHRVREAGDLLDPVRLPQSVLDEQLREMGEYMFSGQYQQSPAPSEGGIIKRRWWRKWATKEGVAHEDPPKCEYILQSYDTAFSTKSTADPTARTTWGIFKAPDFENTERYSLILLECMNKRLAYPDLKTEVIKSWRHYQADVVLVEKKASGQSLLQDLRRDTLIPLRGVKIIGEDKLQRAHVASIVFERGCVYYMDRPWAKEVLDQCSTFPNSTHDDIVDTVTQAVLYVRKRWWMKSIDDMGAEDIDYAELYGRKKKRKYYGG